MALIKCPECGREISDKAASCPNCGMPLAATDVTANTECRPSETLYAPPITIIQEKYRGAFATCRLILGILSIVFSLIILAQSLLVGVANTLTSSKDIGGSAGFLVFILFVASGIIAIVTRNSKSKIGPLSCSLIYLLGGLIGISNSNVYSDLKIWSTFAFICAIIFFAAGIGTHEQSKSLSPIRVKDNPDISFNDNGDSASPTNDANKGIPVICGTFSIGFPIIFGYLLYEDTPQIITPFIWLFITGILCFCGIGKKNVSKAAMIVSGIGAAMSLFNDPYIIPIFFVIAILEIFYYVKL